MSVTVTLTLNGVAVPVELDDAALAAIAAAVAPPAVPPSSPWLFGAKAAAAYLEWPLGRVQKLTAEGTLPHSKKGKRCAYERGALDKFVEDYWERGRVRRTG